MDREFGGPIPHPRYLQAAEIGDTCNFVFSRPAAVHRAEDDLRAGAKECAIIMAQETLALCRVSGRYLRLFLCREFLECLRSSGCTHRVLSPPRRNRRLVHDRKGSASTNLAAQ